VTRDDLASRSAELRAGRVPFVHARVVLAERPTSAKPGDEAIVLADGAMEGFVGGECAEATVRQQALAALPHGEGVLLRITPHPSSDHPSSDHPSSDHPSQGHPSGGPSRMRVVHNPCLSGGVMEVFLEPVLPPPLIQVVGDTPIAASLAVLGGSLGCTVVPYEGHIGADAAALVVPSHGRGEEEPLRAALESKVAYVALVASRKRGEAVLAGLAVAEEAKAKVHTPAGLDIGAVTAEEVALSILAEIVSCRRGTRPGIATDLASQ